MMNIFIRELKAGLEIVTDLERHYHTADLDGGG